MSYVWGVSCLLKTFFLILLTFWTFLFTISIILKYGFFLDFMPVINSSPLFLTKNLKDYQNQLSSNLIKQYFLNKKSLVIDIGSNDGTLLSGFKKKCKILGIEPTNTAKIANKNGIKTIQNFINEGLAIKIVKKYGKADLITATNVFAHMADLGGVIRSIEILLKNHDKKDQDIVHDLELFGVVNTHAKDLEKEIKENFLKSKIFNWLIARLKKAENQEIYFGSLSSIIHDGLLDDPKPYRQNVKKLQANLYSYIKYFRPNNIVHDQPNVSEK